MLLIRNSLIVALRKSLYVLSFVIYSSDAYDLSNHLMIQNCLRNLSSTSMLYFVAKSKGSE